MATGLDRTAAGRPSRRWAAVVLATLAVLTVAWVTKGGAANAAPPANGAGDLDQCANGGVGDAPVACAGSAWVNGNLNANQAHYREGDSVPYRLRLTGLAAGSHTVTIEWDTTKSGTHATDYLTDVARTEATADPCSGVSGCSTFSTFPIPPDPAVSGGGVTQVAGAFRLHGGAITAASPYSVNGTYASTSSTRITLTFSATSSTAVLAWAGHIASRVDWGEGNSAVTIPGSPYHMRFVDLDGSGGNQDRSLSTGAIIVAPDIATAVSTSQVAPGTAVTDTATLSGPLGSVTGSVRFSLCGPQATASGCASADPSLAVVGTSSVVNGVATSPSVARTPATTPATYCFLAEYLPASGSPYVAGSHTNATTECFTVAPTSLTVTKSAVATPVVSGNPIGFTISVHNTSTVAINGVQVTDTLPAGYTWSVDPAVSGCSITSAVLGCSFSTLGAGSTQDITVTAPTANGTNCGTVTNTAGVSYTGQASPQTATGSLALLCSSIDLTKDADQTVVSGGTATFTITVTNAGEVPLTGVSVADAATGACVRASADVVVSPSPAGTLGVGQSFTYSCDATGVAAGFTNTAVASGSDGTHTLTAAASAAVHVSSVAIAKTPDVQKVAPGSTAMFTITVTNDGEVALSDVAVSDPRSPGCDRTIGALAVGAATTYTCTTIVDADLVNIATVTATDPAQHALTGTDDAAVDALPLVAITKQASVPALDGGGSVVYTYTVTTPGAEALSAVTVTDDKCAPVAYQGGDADNDRLLEPGESWTFTCAVTLSASTTNIARVTAQDPTGNVATAATTATVAVVNPGLSIDKSANPPSVNPGETVTYTYVVRDTGDDPLSQVVVADDKCAPVTFQGGDTDGDAQLDPAESWTYTCAQVVNGDAAQVTNVGTVTAKDRFGNTLRASDTETIAVVLPEVIERAPELPRTGARVAGWLEVGLSLVLLGFALAFATRRRPGRAS